MASTTENVTPPAEPAGNFLAFCGDCFVQRGNESVAAVVDVAVATFQAASLEVCRIAATIVGPLNPFRGDKRI